jgi:CDP-glucose 4,6-dehydratase
MARVFVTGATGLVGSWLVKALLARGDHVVCLVRDADPQSELFRSGAIGKVGVVSGALEDYATLERAINDVEPDTVFHLGAQAIVAVAHRSPLPTLEANVRGTWNLLEACRIHSGFVRRVVVASSDKAYGTQTELPYVESQPLAGTFPYEVSKSCTDLITQSYARTYGLPIAIARCGNIYGGGDLNWSRIVPGTVRSLLRGERPVIRSDGTFVRDYVYVQDVVDAYLRLAEALDEERFWGDAFNFSPEQPLTALELVDWIRRLCGTPWLEPEILATAAGEIHDQFLSAAKAREQLGWQPVWGLEAGLVRTIAWYRDYLQSGAVAAAA